MANEIEIINNPTSTPAAVSTGYQRQNTCMVSARIGMDASIIEGGSGQVTCLISGPIDVNGVLYTIKAETVLVPASVGRWYIYLEAGGSASYLTPTLTDDPGTYDETKFARYTSGGKRILNWLIDYDGTTCRVSPWKTPEYSGNQNYLPDLDSQPETWITASGTWVAPRSKYYTIWVTGKGGDGGTTSGNQNSASGGNGGATGIKRMFINAGDVWTATFGSTYTDFTNGVVTLRAYRGGSGTVYYMESHPNVNLIGYSSGFDYVIEGGQGFRGVTTYLYDWAGVLGAAGPVPAYFGGNGGASFYGGGGDGAHYSQSTNQRAAQQGYAPGSGGGGGCYNQATGGAGAPGVIRIVG